MAITILKHGKKVYNSTCIQCGCEFLYNDEDIKQEKQHWLGEHFTTKFVECPDCNNHIILDALEIKEIKEDQSNGN